MGTMKTELPFDGHRCLSDLELGDLVAGRLDEQVRQRAQRHLVECETCYELFEEAHLLLAEEQAVVSDDGGVGVHFEERASSPDEVPAPIPFPGPRRHSSWTIWGIAASLVVGVGLALLLPSGPAPQQAAVRWPALDAATPAPSDRTRLTPLPSARANRGTTSSSRTAGDFRLGAGWVQLEAAARLGEIERSSSDVAELRSLIVERAADGEISPALEGELRALLSPEEGASRGFDPAEIEALLPRLANEMRQRGYEFDLGRFASSGRLAAAAGSTEWFAAEGFAEKYLRAMLAFEADGLSATARRGLDAINRAWPKQGASTDLFAVGRAFDGLIRDYDLP